MRIDVAGSVLGLLAKREPGATICPSEVARMIADDLSPKIVPDWQGAMPLVHAAVDQLVAQGKIRLSWQGRVMLSRSGPYRIRRALGGWTDT